MFEAPKIDESGQLFDARKTLRAGKVQTGQVNDATVVPLRKPPNFPTQFSDLQSLKLVKLVCPILLSTEMLKSVGKISPLEMSC